jgi:hypothetical protein
MTDKRLNLEKKFLEEQVKIEYYNIEKYLCFFEHHNIC